MKTMGKNHSKIRTTRGSGKRPGSTVSAFVLGLALTVPGIWLIPSAQAELFAVVRDANGNNTFTNGAIKEFNATTGALVANLVTAGSGGLTDPVDLDVGPDGYLYVSDLNNNVTGSIKRYNAFTGAFIDNFITGIPNGGPLGIHFGPDGYLYVQAYYENTVRKYDTNGVLQTSLFTGGTNLRDFTWTPAGEVVTISPGANNIYRYASNGTLLATYPLNGTAGNARFTVDVSTNGDMYVGVLNLNTVEHYDSAGNYLGDLVTAGSGGLANPLRLRIGPDGDLYVSSYNMSAIKRYDLTTGAFIDDFAAGFTVGSGTWGFAWGVPEPTTATLLMLGMGAIARVSRRSK